MVKIDKVKKVTNKIDSLSVKSRSRGNDKASYTAPKKNSDAEVDPPYSADTVRRLEHKVSKRLKRKFK
jgi:hypothetical protein